VIGLFLRISSLLVLSSIMGLNAYPISRWGNGNRLVSNDGYLNLEKPAITVRTDQVTKTEVSLLLGWPSFGFGLGQVSGMRLDELTSTFPEFAGLEANELRSTLASAPSHWQELSSPQECLLVFESVSPETLTRMFVWGAGAGVVVSTNNSSATRGMLDEMQKSIQLPLGCLWKPLSP
jgi:hypothetical protein